MYTVRVIVCVVFVWCVGVYTVRVYRVCGVSLVCVGVYTVRVILCVV